MNSPPEPVGSARETIRVCQSDRAPAPAPASLVCGTRSRGPGHLPAAGTSPSGRNGHSVGSTGSRRQKAGLQLGQVTGNPLSRPHSVAGAACPTSWFDRLTMRSPAFVTRPIDAPRSRLSRPMQFLPAPGRHPPICCRIVPPADPRTGAPRRAYRRPPESPGHRP